MYAPSHLSYHRAILLNDTFLHVPWDSSKERYSCCSWISNSFWLSGCLRLSGCSGWLFKDNGWPIIPSLPSEAIRLASSRGTSGGRPKQQLSSKSVANVENNSWEMGKLNIPTWGCCQTSGGMLSFHQFLCESEYCSAIKWKEETVPYGLMFFHASNSLSSPPQFYSSFQYHH